MKLPLVVVFIGSLIYTVFLTIGCVQASCGSADQRTLWMMLSLTIVSYAAFAREGR